MPRLLKSKENPIITPRLGVEWESTGTFNPGAALYGGVVHLLYRATDTNKISRLGHATIKHGYATNLRPMEPVLFPSTEWEEFGCEDPRITELEGIYYVTYTAYSRHGPRIALASTKDLVCFAKHGIVGPNLNDKDCVIFPERIDGKITLLHRLESRVQIAYFKNIESLTGSKEYWSEYLRHFRDYEVFGSQFSWEARKVGVGPPPIKTNLGWLVIYHGVSIDYVYSAGAILLDLDNPSKVIGRTRDPILVPETNFEKHGVVPNVVFPDGAVVLDGILWVYYGGADKVCCVASIALDELLLELKKSD